MLFKDITIITEDFTTRERVDVIVQDDRIASIADAGESSIDSTDASTGEVIDGRNFIMMPGFFNGHAHSPMTLMRGYGEGLNLQDWLFTRIFPFEDKLTSEAVYYGTKLAMAESLRFGIVSSSDMYYFLDDMIQAVIDSGAKINVSRAIANPEGVPFSELQRIKEMIDVEKRLQGAADGRVIVDAALHAEYTSNEETARGLAELSKELGLIMHVHVSETLTEHEECKTRHEGRTPTKYLADCGIFDIPAIAAHCVHVEPEDIEILADKGVYVATNPVSNLKLASGICDVNALLKKGVKVTLGTDGTSSNNNLSMFEEMKTMSILAKVKTGDPTTMGPNEALKIATRNGALAQGRDDSGLIKEGYKADLVLLRKDTPNMWPAYDLVDNIVLAATDADVYLTMVDGKVLYKDGEYTTIDLDDTIKGVERSIKDILSRL